LIFAINSPTTAWTQTEPAPDDPAVVEPEADEPADAQPNVRGNQRANPRDNPRANPRTNPRANQRGNPRGGGVAGGAVAGGGPAFVPPQPGSGGQMDTPIEIAGKLKGAQGQLMVLTREDGTEVTVMLHQDPTRLRLIADAKRTFLRPQMLIRADVTIGPTGGLTAPVELIEVFQPVPMASLPGYIKEQFTPGIRPRGQDAPNPRQGFVPGNYSVIGMIIAMDAAGLYVNTGAGKMPIPLSPEAKIGLVFNNFNLAQPGDPVTVTGFHLPPDETKVIADQITIRPERVFGEAEENGRRRQTRTRTTRTKPATDDNSEPPAAEPPAAEPPAAEPPAAEPSGNEPSGDEGDAQ
jgi:hypothetical protein